jgi:hypothetical protein
MRTLPSTRPRMPSEIISGANVRIAQGVFGQGDPRYGFSQVDPRASAPGLYYYHEGDLFAPGTGNWVFETTHELPLVTIWGNAFLRRPNTFKPLQPPQVMANPTVRPGGVGGLQAGTVELEPLYTEEF